jgi:hypothetical protein
VLEHFGEHWAHKFSAFTLSYNGAIIETTGLGLKTCLMLMILSL